MHCVCHCRIFVLSIFLQFKRLRKSFDDIPQLIDFVQKSLVLFPADRASARDLLNHKYLEGIS